jgi:tRNA(Ile)-lysidine synthase
VGQLSVSIDFATTETLRELLLKGRAGQKLEIANGLLAERTARELRLDLVPLLGAESSVPEYSVAIPGEILAPAFGLNLQIRIQGLVLEGDGVSGKTSVATLRNWRPGDRVRLRYSSGERKVKEVLARMRVTGSSRSVWPVLEIGGRIVWMKGVEVEPEPGLKVDALELEAGTNVRS